MGKLRRRPLEIKEILRWARSYREWTGKWPTVRSGPVGGIQWETWVGIEIALRQGARGLPGGSSLARLLAENFGARNTRDLPTLSVEQILQWADAHHERTGSWPKRDSGIIPDSNGETWQGVSSALTRGIRGLPGGLSLAKVLAEHRGVRNHKALPRFMEEKIVAWADAHRARTGCWPAITSGPIAEAPGETWDAVDSALKRGRRGLPGGSSLSLLLAENREAPSIWTQPKLTISQIVAWADAFHARTGDWPGWESGPIPEAPSETWNAVLSGPSTRIARIAQRSLVERGSGGGARCAEPGQFTSPFQQTDSGLGNRAS